MIDTSIKLPGLNLKNPIIPASGTFGVGRDFRDLYDLSILGGIALKSCSLEERLGNKTPRIAETKSGMLNAVGLQNPGVDKIIEKDLPWLEQFDTEVILNIAGKREEDYVEVIKKLNNYDVVKAYELNISCPNVKHGISIGVNPDLARKFTKMCKENTDKKIYVKLSPNVTDITEIAQACQDGGADGLVMINTLMAMKIDIKKRRPLLANLTGGLSGPAIKPVAIRMIYQTYKKVSIPIIGVGGIENAEDVIEFLLAGASAVEVGSRNLVNPFICKEIIEDLPKTMEKYNFKNIREIIGGAHD